LFLQHEGAQRGALDLDGVADPELIRVLAALVSLRAKRASNVCCLVSST
jgi:hypothetical protein